MHYYIFGQLKLSRCLERSCISEILKIQGVDISLSSGDEEKLLRERVKSSARNRINILAMSLENVGEVSSSFIPDTEQRIRKCQNYLLSEGVENNMVTIDEVSRDRGGMSVDTRQTSRTLLYISRNFVSMRRET